MHSTVVTHLPTSISAESHKGTSSSRQRQKLAPFNQQLHSVTGLTFNKNTFAFPLAALSVGSQREEEQ